MLQMLNPRLVLVLNFAAVQRGRQFMLRLNW